jgi:hypothetical protein
LTAVDRDPHRAIEASEARLKQVLEEEARALLAVNDRFDAETSLGERREAQERWRARVEQELRETARFAH